MWRISWPRRCPRGGKRVLEAAAAALLWLSATAAMACAQGDLSRDPRLHQSVTIRGASFYVAEVCEELARQTGVSIEADEASGASDVRVMVSVGDRPAWRVMDALRSLLTYRMALWTWETDASFGAPRYRLVQSRGAALLPERLEALAQREFERSTAEAIAQSAMTDQDLARRLSDPKALSAEERARWGLQLFSAVLPPDDQVAVLRGEARPTVSVDSLPGWGRRLIEDLYRQMLPRRRTSMTGPSEPAPFPTNLRFDAARMGKATRSLFIDVEAMGGYAYSGGLPLKRRFREMQMDLWIGDGDERSDKAAESIRVPNGRITPQTERLEEHERRCMEIAELTEMPVLARVQRCNRAGSSFEGSRPAGSLLGAYLQRITEEPWYSMHKWRDGFLLITYSAWFCQQEELARPKWAAVRRLREACRRNDGLLPLDALLDAAVEMPSAQFSVLESDWPDAASLADLRDALATVGRDKDLRERWLSSGSVRLSGDDARRAMRGHILKYEKVGPTAPYMTLSASVTGEGSQRRLALDVKAFDGSGRMLFWSAPRIGPGAP